MRLFFFFCKKVDLLGFGVTQGLSPRKSLISRCVLDFEDRVPTVVFSFFEKRSKANTLVETL